MTRLRADDDLDSRVSELIQRGLTAFGAGDLHAAMSYWKHALALDPESRQAVDYVTYVKRHFDVVDEIPAQNAFASAEVELEVPFGLVEVHPIGEIDYDFLETLEVEMEIGGDDDFAEEQPTRVKLAAAKSELDAGWSLEGTGEFEAPPLRPSRSTAAPRLTYEVSQLDIGIGELADALEPEDDYGGGGDDEDLESEIASVTEGLLIAESGAIELEADDDELELELEAELEADEVPELPAVAPARPPLPRTTAFGYKPTIKPHAATLQGMPRPESEPSFELEAEPLELDLGPAAPITPPGSVPVPRAASPILIGDVELDVGERGDDVDAASELDEHTRETADVERPPGLDFDSFHGLDDVDAADQLTEPPGSIPKHPELDAARRQVDALAFELDPLAADLGQPPDVEATPLPREPVRPLELDLELGKAGTTPPPPADVHISYRPATGEYGASVDAIPMGVEPSGGADYDDGDLSISIEAELGGDLEDQLAELEAEMATSGGGMEWRTHDSGIDLEPPMPSFELGAEEELARRQPTVLPEGVDVAGGIVADVDRDARPDERPEERLRRRIFGFIDRAEVELLRENFSVAAVAADLAMSEGPDSAIAQKLIHSRSELLHDVFRRYLGSFSGVPAVAVPLHEISFHELDHRTAFLLSRIDGTLSFEDILDVSGMPRLEALRYLCRLRLQGILEVR